MLTARVPDLDASPPAPSWTSSPAPRRARAVWAGQVVAETTAAVQLEVNGRPVGLGFPLADVHADLLQQGEADAEGRVHSLPGTSPNPRHRRWSTGEVPMVVDGRGALHERDGLAVFDHARVQVELVEEAAAGGETVTRYPPWGDVADLVRQMDVQPEADGSWTGLPAGDNEGRPVAEASQLLGQALVAAVRASGGRRPVSAHLAVLRVADPRRPVRVELEQLAGGRTFTSYAVRVVQDERVRAAGTFLLDVTAPDVVPHQEPAPPAEGPERAEPLDMGMTGRELRVVGGAYSDDPEAPIGPPVIDAWVRMRGVPADPALHIGLLAQFTGHMSIAAAMRPFAGVGQAQAHVTLSTGVNALYFALHRDVRVDEWVRFHHRVTSASGGMSHAQNAAYDERGQLLASFAVESMIRGFGDSAQRDPRTAL